MLDTKITFSHYEDEKKEILKDGILYIEEITYKVFTDGTKEVACFVQYPKATELSGPTQLDRIEEQLAARNDTLRQEGADALTLELLERGIL